MRLLTVVLSAIVTLTSVSGRPQAVLQPALSGAGIGSPFSSTTTAKPQIPIIRHINRVNNDGSYTFGYESGDGSYRVETRGLDGLIQGRYGYVDEHGVRKEVDYMAGSATGYEPRGAGITVPPRPPPRPPGQQFLDYDDGSGTTTVRSRQPPHRQQQPVQQFRAPPPPPPPTQPPPPPPPPPPQITITQPQPQPQFHREIPAPLPQPAPIEFSRPAPIEFSRPAPIEFSRPSAPSQPQPAPEIFRPPPQRHQQAAAASPIEQFLNQQLRAAPQQQPQPQPQLQPQHQLF